MCFGVQVKIYVKHWPVQLLGAVKSVKCLLVKHQGSSHPSCLKHLNLLTASHKHMHLHRFGDYFPAVVIQISVTKPLRHPDSLASREESVFRSAEATEVTQKAVLKYTFPEVL